MNADLGELLREGIERATASQRLDPGLAGRARQRHHRRTLTVRAAAVMGTAAVAAAAVLAATIGAAGTPQPGGGLTAQTTAYVVGHTERALAAAERGSLIERVTGSLPLIPGTEALAVVMQPAPKLPVRLSSLKITQTTSWSYRGRTRMQGFTSDGRLAIDIGPATATRPGGPQPPPGDIAVDPNAGTWYHPVHTPKSLYPVPFTCGNQGGDWLAADQGDLSLAQFTALISKALSCHLFRAAGHHQVGGVDALRLAATPRLLRELHAESAIIGPEVTLWVNSTTFLPVRLVLSPEKRADFGWLKPTATNLAMLRVKVPAGLREVRLPADATLAWEVVFVRTR